MSFDRIEIEGEIKLAQERAAALIESARQAAGDDGYAQRLVDLAGEYLEIGFAFAAQAMRPAPHVARRLMERTPR